ncbi:alpha-E domain-containing protein [Cupriavidus sp. M-11]|uniref:alpha-E domain-containing protein n=1 Tax=Cupriavidus sp. M-11 TaxID=3233038 RepID=UPI003F923C7C
MLSRTADHLFWMARYTERAENTARMLDVNHQTALLPQSRDEARQGWLAMLDATELTPVFAEHHGAVVHEEVLDFMVRDLSHPASIMSCLRAARENARAVRGALTTPLWETINTTWLDVQQMVADGILRHDPAQFFEWVKFRSHLTRGVEAGTMLKDEAYCFMRLGTFLERADNTARLLDVKFQATDPGSQQGDFYQWAAVLRSVSGFEMYRKVYRSAVTPERVAELLIVHPDMPRSLAASLREVVSLLAQVRNVASAETERRAGKLHAELKFARIEDIFSVGIHGWLGDFLRRVHEVGSGVSHSFLMRG